MSAVVLKKGLVHYEAIGRGSSPLIFLHGWLGSWRYWVPAMEELSASRRTYAFDLWGFGDSDKLGDYTVATYVDLLEEFLDEMGIGRAALVGHALGGLIALHFTVQAPERVRQVMGVSVPVTYSAIDRPLAGFSGNGDALARLVARWANYPEVDREARKADVRAIVTSMRSAARNGLNKVPFPFDIPTLLVHGENDPFIRAPQPEWLRGFAENVRIVSLNGTQHFPMLEQRNKFNRLLMEFLNAGDDLSSLELKEEWQRRLR